MKTLGKIIICIIVVLIAIGVSYLLYNMNKTPVNSDPVRNSNTNSSTNAENNNETLNNVNKNEGYIGEEEKTEQPIDDEKNSNTNNDNDNQNEQTELTGKDKAIDIVKKQYAMEEQVVTFDHMEGNNYVIRINSGTAVTWYLVDGTTWEANEY